MLTTTLDVSPDDFAAGTGWEINARGACKADVCVPLGGGDFDVINAASRLGMAIVTNEATGLSAIGPESLGGRALATAQAPEMILGDLDGNEFRLSSLRGKKVVIVSWAPY